jgi:hypothetical protein
VSARIHLQAAYDGIGYETVDDGDEVRDPNRRYYAACQYAACHYLRVVEFLGKRDRSDGLHRLDTYFFF